MVELLYDAALEQESRDDGGESGAQDRYVVGRGFVLECFFPFFRIIVGAGRKVRDGVLGDLVVEVGLEDAVGVCWVPFLHNRIHLVGDRLLV